METKVQKRKGGKRKKAADTGAVALNLEDQEKFEAKVKKIDAEERSKPGTLYLGHLPHGFYENEVSKYFSQFGTVTRVRLARSKKTGGHKGYGYIQFASEDVAKIAAEAMHNYLMFDKLLQCKLVPESQLHHNIWKGANKRFVFKDRAEKDRRLQNRLRTDQEKKKALRGLLSKENRKRRKLKSLGINYEFPGFSGALQKQNRTKVLVKKKKIKSKLGGVKSRKQEKVSKKSKPKATT